MLSAITCTVPPCNLSSQRFRNRDLLLRSLAIATVWQMHEALQKIRAENRELDLHHHDSEKTINATNVKMATIEQQLRDKDELLEKMSALLEASNSQKSQLEDTVALLKSTTQKYDAKVKASIAEIHKGNGYIDQLSTELQSCKSTVKLKSAIIRQQEQLLQEKDTASANSSQEASNLRAEILRHKASCDALQVRSRSCFHLWWHWIGTEVSLRSLPNERAAVALGCAL